MITIPTTELIGGISDVLGVITNPKSTDAGIGIRWDGEALHFAAFDVQSGVAVRWIPGEGAEGDLDEDEDGAGGDAHSVEWGGDDSPWTTWISYAQAKEIVKLFKLPAKLWRFPVTMKCSLAGDRLTIERTDSPKGERLLSIPGEPDRAYKMPDMWAYFADQGGVPTPRTGIELSPLRYAGFAAVRPHGTLKMEFGGEGKPFLVTVGSRLVGFVYPVRESGTRHAG